MLMDLYMYINHHTSFDFPPDMYQITERQWVQSAII